MWPCGHHLPPGITGLFPGLPSRENWNSAFQKPDTRPEFEFSVHWRRSGSDSVQAEALQLDSCIRDQDRRKNYKRRD